MLLFLIFFSFANIPFQPSFPVVVFLSSLHNFGITIAFDCPLLFLFSSGLCASVAHSEWRTKKYKKRMGLKKCQWKKYLTLEGTKNAKIILTLKQYRHLADYYSSIFPFFFVHFHSYCKLFIFKEVSTLL